MAPREIGRWASLAAVPVLALAVGCASVAPPHDTLAQADLAVRAAEQATATQHAPLALHQAREKLEQAQERMEEEEYLEARRLAEDALARAQLAQEKALNARAQETARELRRSIEALRTEAERAGEMRARELGVTENGGTTR